MSLIIIMILLMILISVSPCCRVLCCSYCDNLCCSWVINVQLCPCRSVITSTAATTNNGQTPVHAPPAPSCHVRFTFDRTPLARMHEALAAVSKTQHALLPPHVMGVDRQHEDGYATANQQQNVSSSMTQCVVAKVAYCAYLNGMLLTGRVF